MGGTGTEGPVVAYGQSSAYVAPKAVPGYLLLPSSHHPIISDKP